MNPKHTLQVSQMIKDELGTRVECETAGMQQQVPGQRRSVAQALYCNPMASRIFLMLISNERFCEVEQCTELP